MEDMRSGVRPQFGQALFIEIPERRHEIEGEAVSRRRIAGIAVDLSGVAGLGENAIDRSEVGFMDEQIHVGQRACPANAIKLQEDSESFQDHERNAGLFEQRGEGLALIERGRVAVADPAVGVSEFVQG